MLDRLPEEVLCSVFRHLLPPVTWRSTPRRHRTLLVLTDVSVHVARAAQKLLFEVVHLDGPRAACRWYQAVEDGSRARQLALHYTRTLIISSTSTLLLRPNILERVFGCAPAIRELWLYGVSVKLLSLSLLPQLNACYMTNVTLHAGPQDPKKPASERYFAHLPSLRLLALTKCDVLAGDGNYILDLEEILRTESLPQLKMLAVTWDKRTSDPFTKRLDRQLSHLFLRRLRSTRLSAPPIWPELPRDELSRMTGLKHLSVDLHRTDDCAALARIPIELASVRLDRGELSATELERELLSADLRCFDNLDALIVEQVDRREAAFREATRHECEARDVYLHEMAYHPEPLEEHRDEREWFRLTRAMEVVLSSDGSASTAATT
ncbi:hypothetical protein JCM10449v2_007075 [Rhodotorula kratochvilovae]